MAFQLRKTPRTERGRSQEEQTKILHEVGILILEKRATRHNSSKKGQGVISNASGEKCVMRKRSSWRRKEFREKHQEEVSVKTRRFGMKQEEKVQRRKTRLWTWAQSNGTKSKNLLNEWDTVLAVAVEEGNY